MRLSPVRSTARNLEEELLQVEGPAAAGGGREVSRNEERRPEMCRAVATRTVRGRGRARPTNVRKPVVELVEEKVRELEMSLSIANEDRDRLRALVNSYREKEARGVRCLRCGELSGGVTKEDSMVGAKVVHNHTHKHTHTHYHGMEDRVVEEVMRRIESTPREKGRHSGGESGGEGEFGTPAGEELAGGEAVREGELLGTDGRQ